MNKVEYLKYGLVFFFFVDVLIFLLSLLSPEWLVSILSQFDVESIDNSYIRLVGILFLTLGVARLYGGLFIDEKGAFQIGMWTWVIEFLFTSIEIYKGVFIFRENILALIACIIMFSWSYITYKKLYLG